MRTRRGGAGKVGYAIISAVLLVATLGYAVVVSANEARNPWSRGSILSRMVPPPPPPPPTPSTICYPDGCAHLNFYATKDQWDQLFGNQGTLAKTFEVAIQMAIAGGDTIWSLTRNAAGNITFVGCGNSHTHELVYNCTFQYSCVGDDLVDYCGNRTHCAFQCSNGACVNGTQCPVGYVYENGSCIFSACPLGYTLEGTQCVFTACPTGYVHQGTQCIFSACPSGYVLQGNQCVRYCPSRCDAGNLVDCNGALLNQCAWGCSGGACNATPAPSATLSATPSLVRSGDRTQIVWSAQNVKANTCTVTGTNGDSWTGASGSEQSSPLTIRTTYTLHCDAYDGATPSFVEKQATVNIVPVFEEQ